MRSLRTGAFSVRGGRGYALRAGLRGRTVPGHVLCLQIQRGRIQTKRARAFTSGTGVYVISAWSVQSIGQTGRTRTQHQQNVKTNPGPPRGVIVPLALLVQADPPCSTFSVKFQKVWIRLKRSGPGGPRGPQPPLVD